MPTEYDINSQFREALDILEKTEDHLFITGNAGTGKSTLLKLFREKTEKNIVVLAPTGVAAVNIGGETIHSFFKFQPNISPSLARTIAKKYRQEKVYHAIQTLIIDEISMVRADLLDCVDVFLRTVRKNHHPFGGVQLVMIGDLHQLPPVVTNEERESMSQAYSTPYFFSAEVFPFLLQSLTPRFRMVELRKIYRQADQVFVDLLNKVRNKCMGESDLEILNQCYLGEKPMPDNHIILTATNEQADRINEDHMRRLNGDSMMYFGTTTGSFAEKSFPTAEKLTIKEGARVMLLNNDKDGRWINGTLGTVEIVELDHVRVRLDEGISVKVEPFTWTMYKSFYNEETRVVDREEAGSFKQLPLRLAWAITIHKSQGKTFEKVVVDLGRGAFAHGQTYVALSRVTNLDGLKLVQRMNQRQIIMDLRIINFMNLLKKDLGLNDS